MNKPEKAPEILILRALTPTADSITSEHLKYANLEPTLALHAPTLRGREEEFWNAEADSLDEQDAARELAKYYMLLGLRALNDPFATEESKQLWSDRYTQAGSELFGVPDGEVARQLLSDREKGVESLPFQEAARQVSEYLNETYAPVYEALEIDNTPEYLTPEDIAERFTRAKGVLAEQYDPAWLDWEIELNEEKDSLSVIASEKKIVIGQKRALLESAKLKGLFSHEILKHAQSAINGAKKSEMLGAGLPGYLDAEEGQGVFMEYAVNGELSEKNIDRYVDIAYAMGLIDGAEHTRAELLDLAMERAIERSMTRGEVKDSEEIKKEVYAHVNRIYRGSLGDNHVAIFPKDISYHQGFVETGKYIDDQLQSGKPIKEIMEYLCSGKFDPSNEAHVKYLEKLSS
jgi:hypothetical protein